MEVKVLLHYHNQFVDINTKELMFSGRTHVLQAENPKVQLSISRWAGKDLVKILKLCIVSIARTEVSDLAVRLNIRPLSFFLWAKQLKPL